MLAKSFLNSLKFYLFIIALIITAVSLQYKLLFGKNNVFTILDLQRQIIEKREQLFALTYRNHKLAMKVDFLKQTPNAYEEQARYELGMQKPNETYYQVFVPIK